MGLESSKESTDHLSSTHGYTSPFDSVDVATFEEDEKRMREISRMDSIVRSRFQQGVRYNMKILLCGYKGTGKSLLWKRFQGQPYSSEVSQLVYILCLYFIYYLLII